MFGTAEATEPGTERPTKGWETTVKTLVMTTDQGGGASMIFWGSYFSFLFLRPHMLETLCGICFSLSDLFHLA